MTAPAVEQPSLIIRTAADLLVGDWVTRADDSQMMVTHLNPPTRAEALECGRREVWSYTSCMALDAGDPVQAQAGEYRLALVAQAAAGQAVAL
ncbi:hypothetical protein AB0395_32745 [Streptosporangium sp. NPDC051023]|uniref:hypothetical protein n=1 Tax=Streptosporangium sp. NPDC051023 TaxID=3155410 RepID=UPI00344C276C